MQAHKTTQKLPSPVMLSRPLFVGCGTLLLLLSSIGCSSGPGSLERQNILRDTADEHYLHGRYSLSLRQYEVLRGNSLPSAERCRIHLQSALAWLSLGDIDEAEKALQKLDDETDRDRLYPGRAALARAEILVRRKKVDEALEQYERAADLGNLPTDEILMRAAVIARQSGRWTQAHRFLLRLKTLCPESRHHFQASKLLEEPYYFIQVGVFQEKKRANNLVQRLERSASGVRITEIRSSKNGTLHQVRIGHFSSRQRAEQVRNRLIASRHLERDAFVAP